MTISLHLEAANVSELQRMCAELAHSGAPVAVVELAEAITAESQITQVAADVKKPGRKPKSTEAPPSAVADIVEKPAGEMTQTAVSPPAAEASAGALSVDDVREKFRTLSTAKGLPAVTAILHTFKIFKDGKFLDKKVERISDLAPSDFAAVIAKVDAALSQS